MGELEQRSKKRARRKNVQKIILAAVAAAGVIALAAMAPAVVGAMRSLGMTASRRQKEIIARARDRLIEKGFLERRKEGLRLTRKGEAAALIRTEEFSVPRPKRWDKKWRVLIFDIAERKKSVREHLRRTLMDIGFVRLQDSVWAYPYDCEDLIAFLKLDRFLGKEALYMIVEELEGDAALRKHFNLPREE